MPYSNLPNILKTLVRSHTAMQAYVTVINQLALLLYPRMKPDFNIDMLAYNLYAWQGLQAWATRIATTSAPPTTHRTEPVPSHLRGQGRDKPQNPHIPADLAATSASV